MAKTHARDLGLETRIQTRRLHFSDPNDIWQVTGTEIHADLATIREGDPSTVLGRQLANLELPKTGSLHTTLWRLFRHLCAAFSMGPLD
jgi:hypothetical protein